jgi:hypothetical protein
MMSKWAKFVDTTEFDGGGSGFDPIPDKTVVRGTIEKVEHRRYQDDPSEPLVVAVTFRVLEPEQYANRLVFLNLKINDADEKKAAKAMAAYAAIDSQMSKHYVGTVYGTSLVQHICDSGGEYEDCVDNNILTACWVGQGGQFLTIRLGLTKPNDEGKEYQWLMQVLPVGATIADAPKAGAGKPAVAKVKAPPKPPSAPKPKGKVEQPEDDADIPY